MRIIYSVRWIKKSELWVVTCENSGVRKSNIAWRSLKTEAVATGVLWARDDWKFRGHKTQLKVYKKNGQIAYERTYGKDPERSKG